MYAMLSLNVNGTLFNHGRGPQDRELLVVYRGYLKEGPASTPVGSKRDVWLMKCFVLGEGSGGRDTEVIRSQPGLTWTKSLQNRVCAFDILDVYHGTQHIVAEMRSPNRVFLFNFYSRRTGWYTRSTQRSLIRKC